MVHIFILQIMFTYSLGSGAPPPPPGPLPPPPPGLGVNRAVPRNTLGKNDLSKCSQSSSDFEFTLDESLMKNSKVRQQGSLGVCYAETAAQGFESLYNHLNPDEPPVRASVVAQVGSIIEQKIATGESGPNATSDVFFGGSVCAVFNAFKAQGFCPLEDFENTENIIQYFIDNIWTIENIGQYFGPKIASKLQEKGYLNSDDSYKALMNLQEDLTSAENIAEISELVGEENLGQLMAFMNQYFIARREAEELGDIPQTLMVATQNSCRIPGSSNLNAKLGETFGAFIAFAQHKKVASNQESLHFWNMFADKGCKVRRNIPKNYQCVDKEYLKDWEGTGTQKGRKQLLDDIFNHFQEGELPVPLMVGIDASSYLKINDTDFSESRDKIHGSPCYYPKNKTHIPKEFLKSTKDCLPWHGKSISSNHQALIIGIKKSGGRCYYKIRNSSGSEFCEQKANLENSHISCASQGDIWVPEGIIISSVDSMAEVKQE